MTAENPIAELSHIIELGELPTEAVRYAIAPSPEQREVLRKRLDLIDLSSLSAEVELTICGPKRVRADVIIKANVVQSCVVTLEPVSATVEERASQEFAYEAANTDTVTHDEGDVWVDPEEEPEFLIDDRLDLGELVAQHLSLALDPYPRKPGATFDGYRTDDGSTDTTFAALGNLTTDAARKPN